MKRMRGLIRKALAPKVLKHKKTCGPAAARHASHYSGPPTVLRLLAQGDDWNRAQSVWQQLWGPWFEGQSILVKVNLNTADPYPASTCPVFLRGFLQFLKTHGAGNVLVGDCSSLSSLPTRKTARQIGLGDAVAGVAELVYFDEMDWVEVTVPGHYLNSITVPALVHQVDRIVNLVNLKTHHWADFSMAMKAAVGYMHPLERYHLHEDHLQQKIVELNMAVMADLNVIDGRVAMISGGPAVGQTAPAGLILVGDHPAAVDLQAYKDLFLVKQQNNCLGNFSANPLDMQQFQHAARVWPAEDWQDYRLLQF